MTISMGKTYRTRDGREVRIYCNDGGGRFPVHGAILCDGVWQTRVWTPSGGAAYSAVVTDIDLIEVRPKIARIYWLIHWSDPQWHPSLGPTREYLERNFIHEGRAAITGPHTVEFTEGEGL